MISHLCKRNDTLTNKQGQYKDALRMLNTEVTKLKERLKEEVCQREEKQKAKATMERVLMALLGQVKIARVDVVTEFKAS